jgi:hypothetical protein
VNTEINLQVPLNAGKFLSSSTIGSFSRRTQLREYHSYPYKNSHLVFHVKSQLKTAEYRLEPKMDNLLYFSFVFNFLEIHVFA